jgi:anthranilate synthase component 1
MSASSPRIERLAQVPDLLAMHAGAPERYPFLLESAGGAAGLGRFDVLFAFPGDCLLLLPDGALLQPPGIAGGGDFLEALDTWWHRDGDRAADPGALPFAGGWFLFLGYELAGQVEPRLGLRAGGAGPVAAAVRVPAAIVVDRAAGQAFAAAESGQAGLLPRLVADAGLARPGELARNVGARPLVVPGGIVESDPGPFLTAVADAQRHIAAGDVYQANISREWRAELAPATTPWMLYARLRAANPAPFAGLACLDGVALVSSSPERLLAMRGGRVETRPIAGTRPRRPGEAEGARHDELVNNPKERAEHVMLIDLERSDLGRVCRPGTVSVPEFMVVESYAHVHHIVSRVTGELRPGVTPGQAIRAVFPGGTITGCPKVRCMELIRDLEGRARGAYTGSMGYLGRDGSADLNILIRTMIVSGRALSLSAGSGIVADSEPARELEETRAKAKGMLLSLSDPE